MTIVFHCEVIDLMVRVSDVLLTSDGECAVLFLSLLFDAICPCILLSYRPSATMSTICVYVTY